MSNFHLEVEAEVTANGCAVRAADLQDLSVSFDALNTGLPVAHTLASLVLDHSWAQQWVSSLMRERVDAQLDESLPFEAAACRRF